MWECVGGGLHLFCNRTALSSLYHKMHTTTERFYVFFGMYTQAHTHTHTHTDNCPLSQPHSTFALQLVRASLLL